ncbi:MAG: undecaprenyl-diphosphate phosphatase [Mangrovibacterium sp.]|jgi:undecaprenyl-diphosphatase
MWEIIKAAILGVVEGLTEFLPVSSTGHLILVNQWLAYSKEFTVLFDVFIQMGAILAVIIYFWKNIFPSRTSMLFEKEFIEFWSKVMIAFLPAALLGFLFAGFIEEKLFNLTIVSISLLTGGILLVVLDRNRRTGKILSINQMTYKIALFIGIFQCIAMVPGTSRSAATIIGALLLGCSRKLAAEFSFYLAIPTILSASVYSLVKSPLNFSLHDLSILTTGFMVSFIVAIGVIKFLMNFIKKHSFVVFGYYRIILGIILFVWLFNTSVN